MDHIVYHFYECENPECGLRFPGAEGKPRWNRCPACRSETHIVTDLPFTQEKPIEMNSRQNNHITALLDNIRSAWNVGSIFRTADGLGIEKIYICGISPTPENQRVKKTALGADEVMDWEYSKNGMMTVSRLKSAGYQILALEDLPGATPLFDLDASLISSPTILVVGNEITGIDPGIIEQCEHIVSIPMRGMKHSYNVAIAFSIAASFLCYRNSFNATESPKDHPGYSQAPG